MSTDPLFDPRYDADNIGEIIFMMRRLGYEYDEHESLTFGLPSFIKPGGKFPLFFSDWNDACAYAETMI